MKTALPIDAPELAPWVERYLEFLGVDHPTPSLSSLSALSRAHVQRVPFANTSSVLRRYAYRGQPVPPLDPEATLTSWAEGQSGGVCFEATALLDPLLAELGYSAYPIIAGVSFRGSHQAIVVTLGGRRYLVDVANGSPFYAPIPLSGEVEVSAAGLSYRFRPDDADEVWMQDRWIDGAWAPFCRYELQPASEADREAAYQRHHTPGQSFVTSTLSIMRLYDDEVLFLRNTEFTRFTPAGKHTSTVTGTAALTDLVASEFGLPNLPVADAITALAELTASIPNPVDLR